MQEMSAVARPYALAAFEPAARRLECRLDANDIRLYDDFAHHPTAIRETLRALRRLVGAARLIAVFEPRSNTMRLGVHAHELGPAFDDADLAFVYRPVESQGRVLSGMVEEFVDRVFDGSARPLLVSLVRDRRVSADDLEEVRRMIEESEE